MAPKRRGRPRKSDKPVDDEVEKQETSASAEPAELAEDVVEEEHKPEAKRMEEEHKPEAKRRGRPRKSDKSVEEKQDTSASTGPAEAADEVVEAEENSEVEPSPKKSKVEEKKKRGRKPKATGKKTAAVAKKAVDDDGKEPGEDEEAEEEVAEEAPADAKSEKVVIIEASKECQCFKTRAAKVQTGLHKAIPGIEVVINPDKPRKGCFEVRSKDGNIYMSLLNLPRPFTKLKNVDMDKAVEEIVAKVK